jgi:hypothetical protein
MRYAGARRNSSRGQPLPHRAGKTCTHTARPVSPSRHQEQAAPFSSQLRVVLHGLREILMEGHGQLPRQRLPPGPLRPSSAVMLLEQEVVSEIHAPHRWIALPRPLARILALPVNQVLAANALPAPDRAVVLPLVARPAAVRRDGGHKSGAGCC